MDTGVRRDGHSSIHVSKERSTEKRGRLYNIWENLISTSPPTSKAHTNRLSSPASSLLKISSLRPASMKYMTTATPPADSRKLSRDSNGVGRHRCIQASKSHAFSHLLQFGLLLLTLFTPSQAVFVKFENCLSPNIVNSDHPKRLQLVPLFVWASFNSSSSHNLNITVYGNVSGQDTLGVLPPKEDPQWRNPNMTFGKIPDLSKDSKKWTTLESTFNVLKYTPYSNTERFCNTTLHGLCPIAPVFDNTSLADPNSLPAFSTAHDLYSSYAFTTISTTLTIVSGDGPYKDAPRFACVAAEITPDLGNTLSNVLTYIPLVVLGFVAIATACAAIFSPWGSADIFRFTSNYGRDADLLRLVTPGFGDCLQYIQFVVLAGSLSLNYPGFFQPAVSQVSWSALMFNESFVSHGNGTQSLVDGIYNVNATYGMDRMSQLVGMTADKDIWAGMMVWLLVIIVALVALIQVGFLCRWIYRLVSNTQNEDLRAKNIPFSVGNAIRIVFNYFLLPIVALSMYQLEIAGRSSAATVGLASISIVALVLFSAWLLWLIASTRPRSYLFDDLPTVLLYGPLYNTYSDNAATFALVPVMLTFVRGIAIGAVQPSGIAQLVLLAICEVILILTLNAFRPFHGPTSMNLFHTIFAATRLLTILLSTAFLPSLNVAPAPRGWIGYAILLLHGLVLIFGFFLNACQTLIEVIARLAGAGGEEGVGGGVARGGLVKVFGMRQLSRRNPRRRGQARTSIASDAAMLNPEGDQKSVQLNGGRSRSVSASSTMLLNKQHSSDPRRSVGLESNSATGPGLHLVDSESAPYTPSTAGAASAFSYQPGTTQNGNYGNSPGANIVNLKNTETADPYYRPPRARRPTVDAYMPRGQSRGSWASGDWANRRWSQHSPETEGSPNPGEGPSISGRGTPIPAHLGALRDRSDSNADDPRRSKTDYATREVDFYYGVRGPALSNLPTRRLKTGPADPTGPVSSATGWIKSLWGGKTKDTGKGFEVVRSSRAPPPNARVLSGVPALGKDTQYSDELEPAGQRNRGLALSDEGDAIGGGTRHLPEDEISGESDEDDRSLSDDEFQPTHRQSQISPFPPSLPDIDTGGGIELPNRNISKASSTPTRDTTRRRRPPNVPRRSSRRDSRNADTNYAADERLRLSTVAASPPSTPQRTDRFYTSDQSAAQRLEASDGGTDRLPFESQSEPDQRISAGAESSANSSILLPASDPISTTQSTHVRHSSSALGSHAPDLRRDRPQTMGYIQKYRASVTTGPDEPSYLGSKAEVVDENAGSSGGSELHRYIP